MGFNTVLLVANDFLHELADDALLGQKLRRAIVEHHRDEKDRKSYLPGVQVISVHHADNLAIIAAGGNTGRVVGWTGYAASDADILKSLNADAKRRAKVGGTDA